MSGLRCVQLFESVDQHALAQQRTLIDPVANEALLIKAERRSATRHAQADSRIVAVDFTEQQAGAGRKWNHALDGGVLRRVDIDQCCKGVFGRQREPGGDVG